MNGGLPTALVACLLCLSETRLLAKTKNQQPIPSLPIRVYNPALMSGKTLRCASREAARILLAAGIKTVWELPGNHSPADPGMNMTVPPPQAIGPQRSPVIRIVRHTLPTWAPGALGFALPFAVSGAHVTIFYDRIELLAPSVNVPADVVLALAMAHELGHVLLRSPEHSASASGLMQASWSPARWKLATAGLLSFLPEEAAAMRQSLLAFATRQPQEPSLDVEARVPSK